MGSAIQPTANLFTFPSFFFLLLGMLKSDLDRFLFFIFLGFSISFCANVYRVSDRRWSARCTLSAGKKCSNAILVSSLTGPNVGQFTVQRAITHTPA